MLFFKNSRLIFYNRFYNPVHTKKVIFENQFGFQKTYLQNWQLPYIDFGTGYYRILVQKIEYYEISSEIGNYMKFRWGVDNNTLILANQEPNVQE